MSDTPGLEPEERLPVPRPPVEPAPLERFTSPPSTRSVELTPERAAQVVRQSSNARWVGFLGVIVVALFIAVYWFYELAPLGVTTPRLDAEAAAQQVTSVERGYNLYIANCARCHGQNGEGGIGPALNRQDKLFAHLSEDYLDNILLVGGRYACGDPNSVMPVWSSEANPPGPLNYIQIEELIAFIRAPSTGTYTIRDAELGEPLRDPVTGEIRTFNGWRDENFKPAPDATPYPACWTDEFAAPSAAPSGSGSSSAAPSASAAPSGSPAGSPAPGGESVSIVASGIQFTTTAVTAPADTPFTIAFDNQDAGTPHNVEIKDPAGAEVFKGDIFNGVETRDYQVPALAAGTYPFICTVHPTMTGTLTVQ
ncbi:MAG: cupredoxin domain-containing protein [Chloroflexi bacterium]|nr:cupredoxin domain-containing protein [Chloroflexota bacterium]